MLDRPVDLLRETAHVPSPTGTLLVVVALFAGAWLLARFSGLLARQVLAWHDRRHLSGDMQETGKITNIKRRETLVSVVRAAIGYAGFATALVLSVAQLLGGIDRLTAFAGASFVLIVAGFAVQRVLVDIIAGVAMFAERWYSVGDTISIPALELKGVVEDLSLRQTKLRTLDGEVVHIHNSQIPAVRVLPRGAKEMAVELFVRDRDDGENVVLDVLSILPEGPTTFTRRPWIEALDELDETLVRIRVRASVVPGREWLVEGFFSDLLKERAGDGLIVHGPVALAVDERASRSFARASAARRYEAGWASLSR